MEVVGWFGLMQRLRSPCHTVEQCKSEFMIYVYSGILFRVLRV